MHVFWFVKELDNSVKWNSQQSGLILQTPVHVIMLFSEGKLESFNSSDIYCNLCLCFLRWMEVIRSATSPASRIRVLSHEESHVYWQLTGQQVVHSSSGCFSRGLFGFYFLLLKFSKTQICFFVFLKKMVLEQLFVILPQQDCLLWSARWQFHVLYFVFWCGFFLKSLCQY